MISLSKDFLRIIHEIYLKDGDTKQMLSFLKSAIDRHLDETALIIDQLTTIDITSKPVENGRKIGEIVLHMIRSLEYYSRGLATKVWEVLPYDLISYPSSKDIQALYRSVSNRVRKYLNDLSLPVLEEQFSEFNRPATGFEILLEMLEHSIQHRGQLLVYLRLLDIEPAKIPYII